MTSSKVNILGVLVSATNLPESIRQIKRWIANGTRTYVCVTGVHGVMESQKNAAVKAVHNAAGLVTPDGMPLVYLSRLSGYTEAARVYGPDLMALLCKESVSSGYRHYFYGTTEATLEKLTDCLLAKFPGLQIAGTYPPPFKELTGEESAEIAKRINDCKPDIVWVGLSTPKQELWMATHRPMLTAPVLIGVGAAFDFHSGRVRQAPRWVQPLCLEWLFRLMVEPRRLWKRYLLNNPVFLWAIALQAMRLRKYKVTAG